MRVSMVLVITLADSATPTATEPAPETPKAKESTFEVSVADRVIAPAASILLPAPSIMARVLFVTTLPDSDVFTATELAAAIPPVKLRISASELAVTLRLSPLVTVEPEINVSTLLAITLAPINTDTATLPDAEILKPSERICDSS